MMIYGGEMKSIALFNRPGLRGSQILRIGSEPPAAIIAEPSPPISRQLRTFPQNYTWRTIVLEFKKLTLIISTFLHLNSDCQM